MLELSTYFIYLGLLASIIFILCQKEVNYQTEDGNFLWSYNKTGFQEILILILLSFVVGIRYEVGVDWAAYKSYFDELSLYKNISLLDQRMEVGFVSLNRFVDYVGGDYTLVFAISALISWFFVLKSFPAKLLPLTIFFIFCDGYFFWSMNGVRQFIAIAAFTYALKYIINNDLKRYIYIILLGSLFHKSIILLIPLYFIPYQKLYNRKFWMVAFLVSFVFSRSPFILNGFKSLFISISEYVPIIAGYINYFDSQNYEATEMDGTGLGYMFRIIITLLLIFFSNRVIEKFPETKIYFILFFSGIILFNLFFMLQIVGRFLHYFIFLRAYLLACLVFYFYRSSRYSLIGVGICILYLVLYIKDMFNSANLCCPYQFEF